MGNRIFIIHESRVIQEGLKNIIRNKFDLEPVHLTDIDDFKNFASISNSKIILLIDSQLKKEIVGENIKLLQSSNTIKIVLIRERADIEQCKDSCDCCFSVMDSEDKIHQIIYAHLKFDEKTDQQKSSSSLTEREIDVVKLVAYGKTNKDIANELFISIHTVISHRKNITEKLGIKSISGLTVYAVLNNLIDASSIDLE